MDTLARTPLFEGLDGAALAAIAAQMHPIRVGAHDVICRQGEPGDSLFVIERGLALVMVHGPAGDEPVARLRRGDVVGEMSLVTDERRSATVVAAVPTEVLELQRDAFAVLLTSYPSILLNLTRILSQRLVRTNVQRTAAHRGEAIALVLTESTAHLIGPVLEAVAVASPANVMAVDLDPDRPSVTPSTLEEVLASLDTWLTECGTALVATSMDHPSTPLLLDHMDRIVALVPESALAELHRLYQGAHNPATRCVEIVLADAPSPYRPGPHDAPVVRTVNSRSDADVAWIGRHLARTKLGLALGAGGAKGYAHVGVLQVLEQAGYVVDYVAGSSIGAVVGSWLALGRTAEQIDACMRQCFSPDNVAAVFKLSLAGTSSGLEVMTRMLQESTEGRTFADTQIPLTIMTVDLDSRQPFPIRDGVLWDALVGATALAGMFPPHQRDGHRLVDGLALVPVPVPSVREMGADIVVSVNIMSRDTLDAWPGDTPPEPAQAKSRSRMLDSLLEVMDLAQLDASVRTAALADVPITPRFGPSSWRDFHLADLFLAAGRAAAEQQLASLRSLARPQTQH